MDEVLLLWTPLDPEQVRERIQSRASLGLLPPWTRAPDFQLSRRGTAPRGPQIRARFPDQDHIDLEVLHPFKSRVVVNAVRVTVTAPPEPERSGAVLTCRLVVPGIREALRGLSGVATILMAVVIGIASAFNTSAAPGYRVLGVLFAAGFGSAGLLPFARPKWSEQKPVLRWLATNVEAVVPDEPPLLPWFT